jgi:hypothetical protein
MSDPIDVGAYEAAGVARVEEECDGRCACSKGDGSCDCTVGICNEPADAWCDHCPVHCTCPHHKRVEA